MNHSQSIHTVTELVRVDDIAGLLDVSSEFVYKLARAGNLPHYKIGNTYRFDRRDVLAALQSFRSEPMAGGSQ